MSIILGALDNDNSFDAAVDCLCSIFKETREVDEYVPVIQTLLPQILALQPRIAKSAEEEDEEVFKGLTRIFAEAGEAWVVLIARESQRLSEHSSKPFLSAAHAIRIVRLLVSLLSSGTNSNCISYLRSTSKLVCSVSTSTQSWSTS